MAMQWLKAAQAQRLRWRNDGGWTREIAAGVLSPVADGEDAGAASDWDWRISVAEIEQDGPFSAFPGIDRCLLLLDGPGMDLEFADGGRVRVSPQQPRIDFAGEAAVHCRLLAGPTRDFNVMWRRARLAADVVRLDVEGASGVPAPPAALLCVFHVVSGRLDVDGRVLAEGDSLLLTPPHVRALRLSGSAQVLMTTFQRVSTP